MVIDMHSVIPSYYSLILILVGIFIYIVIKLYADFNFSNKNLIVNIDDDLSNLQFFNLNELVNAIQVALMKNDCVFTIKGLGARLLELGSTKTFDEGYTNMLLKFNKIGSVHNRTVLYPKSKFNFFIARFSYDLSIEHGSCAIRRGKTNNFSLINVTNNAELINTLNLNRSNEKKTVIVINSEQKQLMQMKSEIFECGNASFLFLLTNNYINVVECYK
jgi:hypothetical protein